MSDPSALPFPIAFSCGPNGVSDVRRISMAEYRRLNPIVEYYRDRRGKLRRRLVRS